MELIELCMSQNKYIALDIITDYLINSGLITTNDIMKNINKSICLRYIINLVDDIYKNCEFNTDVQYICKD